MLLSHPERHAKADMFTCLTTALKADMRRLP